MSVRMRGFTSYTKLADALEMVLSKIKQLEPEVVPFERALNRALAEDVVSRVDLPPFDRAAVDGYAVRAVDTFGATESKPVKLRVVGSVDVGSATRLEVRRGEAAKVMTGAPMPKGADAVVMVEQTKAEGGHVLVFAKLPPGKNVSARGEDVRRGEVVLEKGRLLRPQEVGMLAATGNIRVKVTRRPRVAILATGEELRSPGERLREGEIVDVNSYSLAAAVESCGGLPRRLGAVHDDARSLRRALRRAAKYDMALISGGSSVGERDLVPDVITELGELLFHGVAIRPGSPTAFGVVGGKPFFGLPGFPVSALVAFDMLARPALRRMQGLPADRGYPRVRARLARKISSTLGRMEIVRVRVREEAGELVAEPIRIAGSGILSSMTRADGFLTVPEDVEGLKEGSLVEVELYRWPM
ncbi:MAG: molybdopterin molybdotransferase MoeA [Candidatus Hadarchaeales archaeon]